MRFLSRFHTTLLLLVTYLMIIASPLAPVALRSAHTAHAVSGECAGNCAVCGCSPEQSANRTCCCWKKKRQLSREHEHERVAECCKNNRPAAKPVLRCGCPCGGRNTPVLLVAGDFELLPYRFGEGLLVFNEDDLSTLFHPVRLIDRHGDPPDPPPKLALLS